MSTVDDLASQILADVAADFRSKNLGSDALTKEHFGVSIALLGTKYSSAGPYSKVDFDLALKQLEESKLVKTGPMVMYDNPPDSLTLLLVRFSKREFVYLTEKGYKAAQKSPVKRSSPAPTVHISGGNFNQSPIGIGSTVTQAVTFNNQKDIDDLRYLLEVFEKHIDELRLDAAAKRKATTQLITINAQLEDEPDPVIVKQAGRTLRNITEGAIAGLIATAAQPTVWAAAHTIIARLFGP